MPLLGGPNLPSVSWLALMTAGQIPAAEVTSAPGIPDLIASSDSGDSSSDNLTNDTTPSFRTTLPPEAIATDTLRLYRAGNIEIGSKVLDATDISNNFADITATTLPGGTNSITAKVENIAGLSSSGNALVIEVDTVAPDAPILDLIAASDTGSAFTDNYTNDQTPTFRITFVGNTSAGDLCELREGTTVLASKTLDAGDITTGFVDLTSSTLAEAVHAINARLTDDAGNISGNSNSISTTIDITATSAPSVVLLTTSDTGFANNDGVTSNTTPTFEITLPAEAVAGDIIELREGVNQLGAKTLDAGDITNGTVQISPAMGEGSYSVFSRCIDKAGNISPNSSSVSVIIDTTAPSAPTAIIVTPLDQGSSTTQTENTQPTFRISLPVNAVADDRILITINGVAESNQTLSGTDITNGYKDIQSANVLTDDAVYAVRSRVTDLAGNIGALSAVVNITVGTPSTNPASFVDFNGTDTLVVWNTGPTGVANNREGTWFFPFNRQGGSGEECLFYVGTGAGLVVYAGFDSTNHFVFRLENGAGTNILSMVSTSVFTDSDNHGVLISYDLNTEGFPFYYMVVDQVDESGTPTVGTAADIDLTNKWTIGASDDTANRRWFSGASGHILYSPFQIPAIDPNTYKYFMDNLGNIVDNGGSADQIFGAQILFDWRPTSVDPTINLGSGGDASSASSFADVASPPELLALPVYEANALHFDGNVSLGYWGGIPDDQRLVIRGCFNVAALPGSSQAIWGSTTNRDRILLTSTGALNVQLRQNGGTTIFDQTTNETFAPGWHHFIFSVDTSTFGASPESLKLIVDNTICTFPGTLANSGSIDNDRFMQIADDILNAEFLGDLSEMLVFSPTAYVDPETILSTFYDTVTNKPKFIGLAAGKIHSLVSNLSDIGLYLRGPASSHVNTAIGAWNPTVGGAGSITDAATSPTD